jgi:hypothetical protein
MAESLPNLDILSKSQDLGWLILNLTPYKFQPNPDPKKKDLFYIDWQGIEYQEKPGVWTFKGQSHALARSARIPYWFFWRNDTAPSAPVIPIRDYFLVGFEGGGAY